MDEPEKPRPVIAAAPEPGDSGQWVRDKDADRKPQPEARPPKDVAPAPQPEARPPKDVAPAPQEPERPKSDPGPKEVNGRPVIRPYVVDETGWNKNIFPAPQGNPVVKEESWFASTVGERAGKLALVYNDIATQERRKQAGGRDDGTPTEQLAGMTGQFGGSGGWNRGNQLMPRTNINHAPTHAVYSQPPTPSRHTDHPAGAQGVSEPFIDRGSLQYRGGHEKVSTHWGG